MSAASISAALSEHVHDEAAACVLRAATAYVRLLDAERDAQACPTRHSTPGATSPPRSVVSAARTALRAAVRALDAETRRSAGALTGLTTEPQSVVGISGLGSRDGSGREALCEPVLTHRSATGEATGIPEIPGPSSPSS